MRRLRMWSLNVPVLSYLFRHKVIAGSTVIDCAVTKRAARRRTP